MLYRYYGPASGVPDRGGETITDWPYIVQDILLGGVVIFSLSITIIAAMSYKRTRNPKIFKIALSFFLFLVKGIILSIIAFTTGLMDGLGNLVYVLDTVILIDMLILVVLYLSVFKK